MRSFLAVAAAVATSAATLANAAIDTSATGVWIRRNNSAVTLGSAKDVQLERTATGELTAHNSLVVEGDLTADGDTVLGGGLAVDGFAEFADGVTIDGHLEVDKTISTAFGRVTRDFHQFYTTTSAAAYYQMKTSIRVQGNVMFRLEILGYAYGASKNIDSVSTGYTYAGWDCVSNEANVDFGYGNIGVYCSSDGYLVLEYYCPATYFLGLTVNGWFLNPTGTAHDIEVLDTAFSSTTGSFSGRRQLAGNDDGEGDEFWHSESDRAARRGRAAQNAEEAEGEALPALPVLQGDASDAPAGGARSVSLYAMAEELASMRKELGPVAEMREEVAALRARVAELEEQGITAGGK